MDDARLKTYLVAWMNNLILEHPGDIIIELRCRSEIISTFTVREGSPLDEIGEELIEDASNDAREENKTRIYQLEGVNTMGEHYICPLTIRRRINSGASSQLTTMVEVLTKQLADLHKTLLQKDKYIDELTLQYAKEVSKHNRELTEENFKHRNRSSEAIDKLENLRSKQLERDMAIEKHKAEQDMKERLTDAALPLMLAIGSKFTGGKLLPPGDIEGTMLAEVVKGLNEHQLDALPGILGDQWEPMRIMLDEVLHGVNRVKEFRAFVAQLPQEKTMAVFQLLNVGQQAAINELINANGASASH